MTLEGEPQPVWCEDCSHRLHRLDGKELPAWRWLCMAAPREPRPNFVSREFLIDEPYFRCAAVNVTGRCASYEPEPPRTPLPGKDEPHGRG